MVDLITKSFLSYVELKKHAQKDLQENRDIEKGQPSPKDEQNLSLFFKEVEAIKANMEEITNLFSDLQSLIEETKSTYSAKALRGLRDRLDSDMVSIHRKVKTIRSKFESIDKSNMDNRKISEGYAQGTAIDRISISMMNGLRVKLREIMNDFQSPGEKILSDYIEGLKKRYYNATGKLLNEEMIEKMFSGGKVDIFEGKTEQVMEDKERHEAVMDIQRSLNKLHQVFIDMAALVEAQVEQIDDIEHNVVIVGSLVNAKQMKNEQKKNKLVYLLWAVVLIVLLICFQASLSSR